MSGAADPPASPASRGNRLATASSPYLRLHAHNPVDWYPWGEEAFARARREDKPIFLSIGYSTCYWCHVMERESFSDPEIAAAMNRDFVSVKLDREERPDVDEVYMTATQLMTGQGGWPNSLFLTPALEPFFAGTYFPPEDRWGRPGFRSLLEGIAGAWTGRRADVDEQARELGGAVRHHLGGRFEAGAAVPRRELFDAALRTLTQRFDPTWGGFGDAPKFPTPSNLFLLLEAAPRDETASRMLAATLDQMARGGIYDQLAGGFHRYATDREWKVPHFEKMLYDNGSLLEVYARTWALSPDPELARHPELERIIRETVGFLERELSAPDPQSGEPGGFWSAIDAEVGGHEGAFHVWSREELDAALGPEDSAFLAPLYGYDRAPFFEGGRYVLHLPTPLAEQATRRRVGYDELLASIAVLRARLLAVREERPHPATDDKVLADWNGLAIAGLAVAGRLLGERAWVERAARAARFVLTTMRPSGTLLHAWRAGHGEVPAFLADYAYLAHGLLELAAAEQAGGGDGDEWLAAAVDLTDEMHRRLAHPDGGFYGAGASEDLLCRSRDLFDGASPSPNGVAVLNLLALAEATGDARHRLDAERALRGFAPLVEVQPAAARTVAVAVRRFHERARGLEPSAAGLVRAALDVEPGGADGWRPFRVRLSIAAGWHVSTGEAPAPLAATTVEPEGCELRSLELPPATRRLDGAGGEALPVWEGEVELRGELHASAGSPRLRLVAQPCDEGRCLPAVTIDLPFAR